jgi:hypothetical protein
MIGEKKLKEVKQLDLNPIPNSGTIVSYKTITDKDGLSSFNYRSSQLNSSDDRKIQKISS